MSVVKVPEQAVPGLPQISVTASAARPKWTLGSAVMPVSVYPTVWASTSVAETTEPWLSVRSSVPMEAGGDVFVKVDLQVVKRKRDNRTVGADWSTNAQEVRVIAE